jgi:hypothetical protein
MRALTRHALCLVASFVSAEIARANLIHDGGFEQSQAGSPTIVMEGSSFGGWLVGGTGNGSRVYFWWDTDSPEGNQKAQLHWLGGGATISQVVDVQPGGRYELSFAVGNTDPEGDLCHLDVFSKYPADSLVNTYPIASVPVLGFGGTGHDHWVRHTFEFTARGGEERIYFNNPVGSIVLDDIQLFQTAPGRPAGDYNYNGHVDAADYVVWRDQLGHLVDPCSGPDSNCNGFVDVFDYDAWVANYGQSASVGTITALDQSASRAAYVPEPSTLFLVAMLAAFSTRPAFGRRERRVAE